MVHVNWEKFEKANLKLIGIEGCPYYLEILAQIDNKDNQKNLIKDDSNRNYIGKICSVTGKKITSPAIIKCPMKNLHSVVIGSDKIIPWLRDNDFLLTNSNFGYFLKPRSHAKYLLWSLRQGPGIVVSLPND